MKIEETRIQKEKEAAAKKESFELEQAKKEVEVRLADAEAYALSKQNEIDYYGSLITNRDEFALTDDDVSEISQARVTAESDLVDANKDVKNIKGELARA
jgi:hypothetical protein